MENAGKEYPHPFSLAAWAREAAGGAFGAGLVLIVLPSAALIYFALTQENDASVMLPIMAIFGIMVLFGTLALISALFAQLGLSCQTEALALPPGSIRAAIALALIVLFALISVMLYQSFGKTHAIYALSETAKDTLVKESSNHVTAVLAVDCAGKEAAARPQRYADCKPGLTLYTVYVREAPGQESTDLAKQLLILIGTLMTSVTSFYFASRSSEAVAKSTVASMLTGQAAGAGAPAVVAANAGVVGAAPPADPAGAQEDACGVGVVEPTPDHALPAARGGVGP